jgi:hypothetical protein
MVLSYHILQKTAIGNFYFAVEIFIKMCIIMTNNNSLRYANKKKEGNAV